MKERIKKIAQHCKWCSNKFYKTMFENNIKKELAQLGSKGEIKVNYCHNCGRRVIADNQEEI